MNANATRETQVRILFVCMGNLCRSPTAEAVFRHAVRQAGLGHVIECDSAGTHDYHVGDPPDERAQLVAARRGYDMSGLRGRQVARRDFDQFDRVFAMDRHNLDLLARMCPARHVHKLALYGDAHDQYAGQEVPDPYYGGSEGFERVLDMVEEVTTRLLERLRSEIERASPGRAAR